MNNLVSNAEVTVLSIEEPVVLTRTKSRILTFIKHFPWFLICWTFVLLYVYKVYDQEQFAFNCRKRLSYSLISYQLNHDDNEHILTNIIAFWIFGAYTCIFYNDIYNVVLFQVGVLAGSVGFYIDCQFDSMLGILVGSSAGVCSMIGAVIVSTCASFRKQSRGVDITKKNLYSFHIIWFLISVSVLLKDIIDMIQSWVNHGFETTSYSSHFSGYVIGIIIGVFREIMSK